ncbi:MAG: NAD(P)-dependent oxidoreductase [Candidatus Pacebacteria bacterium]|jgi:D-lactate dehydrogenase|nr:NAD(P)-dependent oxidoreductase [Candidatus Paceibacterota bacterium]MDD4994476.1 NAD(P)-dependent oxidoreductase [Candidatus Paceibacterota bacterium]MDD5535453.1 NAD(P)-dependent oxidoreductase [Candidatus Paceibacterota bacterium]
MKKIIFFEATEKEKNILQKYPDFFNLVDFSEEKLTHKNAGEFKDYEIISVFIGSQLSQQVLSQLNNLKFIATRSTGFDHIDLDYCKENGISVSSVPNYGDHTVAEYTFALLLCLIRKVYNAYHQVRETGSFSLEGLQGEELFNKTLGVIGTGKIGREVIKIAKGFSMKVIAYDKYPQEDLAEELEFEYFNLEDLLAQSDVISLHVPYTEETHHLINKDNILKIKPGAYIINTSRGGVIETDALYQALKKNHLAGAALDVLEEEGDLKEEQRMLAEKQDITTEKLKTLLANHIFIDLDNVIISPHNAFNTKEALENILITTMENINGYLNNELKNLI